MAAIEWLATDRHLAYFHVQITAGNFLAFLVQRDEQYMVLARTRIYKVGRASADKRIPMRKLIEAASDYEAVAALRNICEQLCQKTAEYGSFGLPQYTFHAFKEGTLQELRDTLAMDPAMHETEAL